MSDPVFSITVILGYVGQKSHEPEVPNEIAALKGLCDVEVPIELIIVDRAWPERWDLITDTLPGMLERVRYVPVRPTQYVEKGMFAVSGAMNSGAICSTGELLLSSGDFSVFTPKQIELMYRGWFDHGKLYAPVVDISWGRFQIPTKIAPVTGLNVGPRLYSRNMLRMIGGWEEALDGSRGRDDETIDLSLDMVLRTMGLERWRHPELVIHKARHEGGQMPQVFIPPWSGTEWKFLRCNLSFAQKVLAPRRARGEFRLNLKVTKDDIAAMREPCDITKLHEVHGVHRSVLEQSNQIICQCQRGDRPQQLDSYDGWIPPNFCNLQDRFLRRYGRSHGLLDPWPGLVLGMVDEFLKEQDDA